MNCGSLDGGPLLTFLVALGLTVWKLAAIIIARRILSLPFTLATLGARLFAGATGSKSIGCLVMAGNDFPHAAEDWLRDWEMTMIMKRNASRLSTRGLLEYEDTTFGR